MQCVLQDNFSHLWKMASLMQMQKMGLKAYDLPSAFEGKRHAVQKKSQYYV